EDPETRGVARDVVEQDGRGVIGVVEHLGDASDVLFPGGATHVAQLAEVADALDPIAQVAVLHVTGPHRGRGPRLFKAVSVAREWSNHYIPETQRHAPQEEPTWPSRRRSAARRIASRPIWADRPRAGMPSARSRRRSSGFVTRVSSSRPT